MRVSNRVIWLDSVSLEVFLFHRLLDIESMIEENFYSNTVFFDSRRRVEKAAEQFARYHGTPFLYRVNRLDRNNRETDIKVRFYKFNFKGSKRRA